MSKYIVEVDYSELTDILSAMDARCVKMQEAVNKGEAIGHRLKRNADLRSKLREIFREARRNED